MIPILLIFRAFYYCKLCHEDIDDVNLIKKCKCKNCKLQTTVCTVTLKLLL